MILKYKGSSVFYTDQGSGEPLVLLHGFLENSNMWHPMIPELITNHRVICIDLLGHGQTDALGYIHTMEEMAASIKHIIDILQLSNITIIGHSMGGYVGCAFAKDYPEILSSLCLLNSTPDPDSEERKELRARANMMARKQYQQLVRMSFVNLFDPQAKIDYFQDIDNALQEALKTSLQGYMAAMEGMSIRPDSQEFWQHTSLKKGMILGQSDWIIPADDHEQRFKEASDYFRIIEGGHMTHISNASQTLEAIKEFISN